jgi:hypothetical protein
MFSSFYGFLDIVCTPIIPQALQTKLIKEHLKEKNYTLNFYTTESHTTFENMSILKQKVSEKNKFSGFAFYSLMQFSYNSKFEFNLLKKILKKYKCVFIRENVQIDNLIDLKKIENELKIFPATNHIAIKNLKNNFLSITKK